MEKRRKTHDLNASKLSQALMELGRKICNSLGGSGERATEVPGLTLYRCTAPTVPSRFLLTSLELPVVSQVITASEDAPYLAFFLKLDISTAGHSEHRGSPCA